MPDDSRSVTYQFGDSDVAAERLKRLATAFEPASRAFLTPLASPEHQAVLDLGCGPGYTTRMLADLFPAADVRGIDSSPRFIQLARQLHGERAEFTEADVMQPLPGGPYDLVYSRYLLAHLDEPRAAIEGWSHSLRSGGRLALEENEWIRTEVPAFALYLQIVESMLSDAGQKLYIGAELARVDDWPLLEVESSAVVPIEMEARTAVSMFLPNLSTWRSRPFVAARYSERELSDLRHGLEALAEDDTPRITFAHRRLVLVRR